MNCKPEGFCCEADTEPPNLHLDILWEANGNDLVGLIWGVLISIYTTDIEGI